MEASLCKNIARTLASICGDDHVLTKPHDLLPYGRDRTDLYFSFDILVKPASPHEISKILKVCNKYNVSVTPRGGGSGVTGGALPLFGGVVLSLERLNKIIQINQVDSYVVAESGVITETLCKAVEEVGLYFPPSPSSRGFSFIGGNVAENSGSPNSCKYGSTSNYVLNLEVVLASGEIIWTGANVRKNATGLNLTQLFVGSEGTLGIITKVAFRLVGKPTHEIVLLAGFSSLKDACKASLELGSSNLNPSVADLICHNAIMLTTNHLRESLPLTGPEIQAQLLVEFQDTKDRQIKETSLDAYNFLRSYTEHEILIGQTTSSKKYLRRLRYAIGDAMLGNKRKYRDVDISIPPSEVFEYITRVEKICAESHLPLICFGHVLDGNIHTMVSLDEEFPNQSSQVLELIYCYGIEKGGLISGEHGIGLLQKEFMELQYSTIHLSIMKKIKRLFDPNGILNPGKVF